MMSGLGLAAKSNDFGFLGIMLREQVNCGRDSNAKVRDGDTCRFDTGRTNENIFALNLKLGDRFHEQARHTSQPFDSLRSVEAIARFGVRQSLPQSPQPLGKLKLSHHFGANLVGVA